MVVMVAREKRAGLPWTLVSQHGSEREQLHQLGHKYSTVEWEEGEWLPIRLSECKQFHKRLLLDLVKDFSARSKNSPSVERNCKSTIFENI
jgi:hypothetical protein